MKHFLLTLLCALLLLPLTSCGSANNIWKDASPGTSIFALHIFDGEGGRAHWLTNPGEEGRLLKELSAVEATPVTDWSPEQVTLPVYGVEIGSTDGVGIHAAWSNGYLILRDGSVYQFDFDFSALETDYSWDYWDRAIPSLSAMPCGRLLSEGPDGWVADHLSPADEPTAPEGITIALKELTDSKITVVLTNRSETDWMFGEYFSLHTLLDGVWYDVPVSDDKNYGFNDIGIILPAGESTEKSYSLGSYGILPASTYRLVVEGISVEFTRPYTDCSIVSITDETGNRMVSDVEEVFFEDESNRYIFGNPISKYIFVRYADGSEEDIKTALQNGRADIGDLNRFGIHYWIEPKTDDWVTCVIPRGGVVSITDLSQDNPYLGFAAALEPIWEDDANVYSLPCIKSQVIIVRYDDGTEEDVASALRAERITMEDLDAFGIHYITEPKA